MTDKKLFQAFDNSYEADDHYVDREKAGLAFIAAIRADEREACAKIAHKYTHQSVTVGKRTALLIEGDIDARGAE